MNKYLDFEDEKFQKGYELLPFTKDNIKKHKGKKFCYLLKREYDPYRGWFSVSYAVIGNLRYSQLEINEYGETIDIRDVLEAGVEVLPV